METHLSAEQSGQTSRLPDVIELPAPTAWPLALAFGFTLMLAGLLTNASLSVLGLVLAVAGGVGWCRGGLPSDRDLSNISRRKGGLGGECGDGSPRVHLWASEDWEHLVSNQSSSRDRVRAIVEARSRTTELVSLGQLRNGCGFARRRVHPRGLALRCHAADVSASTHPAWRTDCSRAVVGPVVLNLEPSQSTPGESHRLALVHGFPGGLWRSRGSRCPAAYAGRDARKSAVCNAGGYRGSWNYGGETWEG